MISVIIPAYNSETHLRECLDSLLAQTCRDWEAIVVNDGSTDSTAGIVEEYAARDPRFRLISLPNGGQARARNAGVEAARGEWLGFLDSDDAYPPRGLEILLDVAESTGTKLVYGRVEFVDKIPASMSETVESTEIKKRSSEDPSEVRVRPGLEVTLEVIYQVPGGAFATLCDKLWSRELIGDNRFQDGVTYEDLDFNCRMLPRVDRVASVDETVYYYRQNPCSFLHTFSERRFDSLKVTLAMERRSQGNADLYRAARERTMSAAFNIMWLLSIYPERRRAYAEMADRCWEIIKERRWASVNNRQVRFKNRCAALLSYLGRPATEAMLRLGNRIKAFQPQQST